MLFIFDLGFVHFSLENKEKKLKDNTKTEAEDQSPNQNTIPLCVCSHDLLNLFSNNLNLG